MSGLIILGMQTSSWITRYLKPSRASGILFKVILSENQSPDAMLYFIANCKSPGCQQFRLANLYNIDASFVLID